MGGRGRSSGITNRQVSMEQYEKQLEIQLEIQSVIAEGEAYRSDNVVSNGATNGVPLKYKKCACCGKFTVPTNEVGYLCLICGWIDDEYQNKHPYSLNGRNMTTLNDARREYLERLK